jgi:hypothetical protein
MQIKHYEYLNDAAFLKTIDELKVKEQFVKITVLTWNEEYPIAEIQGKATSGTININGSSSVRRTANLTIIADDSNYNILDVNNLLSINKKIELEVGFTNTTNQYTQYKTIWFPEGIYIIKTPSVSHSSSGLTISLQLEDKMCLLNGTCGGNLPAAATFDSIDIEDEDGNITTKKTLIYTIIQQLVYEYGGEALNRIVINDIDNEIKQVMKWTGNKNVYLVHNTVSDSYTLELLTLSSKTVDNITYPCYINSIDEERYVQKDNTWYICNIQYEENTKAFNSNYVYYCKDELTGSYVKQTALSSFIEGKIYYIKNVSADSTKMLITEYNYGDDIGYIYSDFYYSGELTANAGDTITSVLDKIKNTLGNYEYYYDIYGNFIFQEIKNYLNTSKSTLDLSLGLSNSDYLINRSKGKSVYEFTDGNLITSYSNSPQYTNIKNDYIIWGLRKSSSDSDGSVLRYHLVIDTKPKLGDTFAILPYTYDYGTVTVTRAKVITLLSYDKNKNFPQSGVYYYDYDINNHRVLTWNEEYNTFVVLHNYGKKKNELGDLVDGEPDDPIGYPVIVKPNDWREVLYFKGVLAKADNEFNYYYEEMAEEWPKLFEIAATPLKDANGQVYDSETGLPLYEGTYKETNGNNINFYIDFIDSDAKISNFSVQNIGRRPKVVNDTSINCVFAPDIPDFVLIETGQDNTQSLREECIAKGQKYVQVDSNVYDAIATGGTSNSAYDYVRSLLYTTTSYNESISLNAIPIYYLEPNTRITVQNKDASINGDYMIKTISLPLAVSGTMSLSCTKALERI